MLNFKVQMPNEIQISNLEVQETKISDSRFKVLTFSIQSFGIDLNFGFWHLTFMGFNDVLLSD
jgi:hypothetical protein